MSSGRRLTFQEREAGLEVPRQLGRKEISAELRSIVWHELSTSIFYRSRGDWYVSQPWDQILADKHVYYDFRMDRHTTYAPSIMDDLRAELARAPMEGFYGVLEYFLRHPLVPGTFADRITAALDIARAPYRVIDGDTLAPVISPQFDAALSSAIADAKDAALLGASQHLKNASSHISEGKWAESVRESIHSVESVALMLAPGSQTLGPALKALEAKIDLHEALKKGFLAIYGFTSDESGIRHALLEKGDSNVGEADAVFMLGACAAFVSYLIQKGRQSSLL